MVSQMLRRWASRALARTHRPGDDEESGEQVEGLGGQTSASRRRYRAMHNLVTMSVRSCLFAQSGAPSKLRL